MADSKMPAMIWTGPELVAATRTWGMHNYDKTPAANVAFIRADLVEPLVEALQAIDAMNPHDHGLQGLWTAQKIVRAALSSWEAGQ